MNDKVNFKLLNLLIIIAIICLLYFIRGLWIGIVVNIFNVLAPFLLAFALAYVIYPLVRKLIDSGAPKWLAILTVCILGFGSLFIILLLTVPLLYEQILLFISNISMLLSDLSTKYEINFGSLQTTLTDFSSNIISSLGSTISDGAINVVNSSVGVITTGIVVICAAIYFLIDMDKIREGVKKYFNRKNRRTTLYLTKLDDELTKYIGGLGKNILIQVIEYTLAFLLIGHPNYLILGILSGLSAIIPWFGGFLVAVISLLVSSVISTKLFILTVIICIICPILDGNVIGPKVYGKSNKLHPLVVIFAVSAGGVIAGFWGILLSLPIAIIIKTTYNFYRRDIDNKIKFIKKKDKKVTYN
ncbi:MAG: AI-2E family transporter [Bacilli bacterium]|nr:AI-2E family transporter [Bacilli bacterium]